jgi:DNA-binding MarR family transcriptional regulator
MSAPFYSTKNFDCRTSLGYLLRRTSNLMTQRAEALFSDQDLTFTHWITLMALRDGIAGTAADIARHLGYDPGATTRLIDQLQERGLVERTRSKEDRRVVHLALTEEGKSVAAAMQPRAVGNLNDVLTSFSHDDATKMVELLARLLGQLEADVAEKAQAAE